MTPDREVQENDTTHTATEDPICTMKISNKNLQTYHNAIVLEYADLVTRKNIDKNRTILYVKIRRGNENDQLSDFLLEYINPQLIYGVYFKDKNLETPSVKFFKCPTDY